MTTRPASGRPRSLLSPFDPVVVLDLMTRSLAPWVGEATIRHPDGLGGRAVGDGQDRTPRYTRTETAERSGLTDGDLARLWQALGIAESGADRAWYSEADLEVFTQLGNLAADGVIDLDTLVTLVLPMGHLLSRLGAARASALADLRPRLHPEDQPNERLVAVLEQLVVSAWHRHLAAARTAVSPAGENPAGENGEKGTGSVPRAVGFIDIADYTATSQRIDRTALARLLEHFEACVFERVAGAGGRVVKTLGDEALFVTDEPAAAAEIALSVAADGQTSPDVPAVHAGLAYGLLLERAGDVFGPPVNIASRVTDLAGTGSVLVDEAFHARLDGDGRFVTRRRHPRRPVRGYPYLTTYRLQRATAAAHRASARHRSG